MLNKIAIISEAPCEECFQLFRVSAGSEPAELFVHLQSSTTEIELTESQAVYDFVESSETNKYIVYALKGE